MTEQTTNPPFQYLQQLAGRASHLAAGLPARSGEETALWTGIGFRVVGQPCVVPMGDVVEVLHEPISTRLPGVQPWVRGVANVRGRLLPLIDLNQFLGGEPLRSGSGRRVLVLEKGELYTGLIVEEVIGMMHFDVRRYDDRGGFETSPLHRYVRGCYRGDEVDWGVFRPGRLLEDRAFYHVAA